MIPEKVTPMDKEYVDVTVSSIIALVAGWLVKSLYSASRKEVEEIRQEMRHLVTTRAFDKELEGIEARLDRIENKIDEIMKR
jgi:archaellum component FlaC